MRRCRVKNLFQDCQNVGSGRNHSFEAQSPRTTALLKVFRCGPRHDIGDKELAAHVDKPRKEEAAGVLDRAMGKVPGRSGRRLRQGRG